MVFAILAARQHKKHRAFHLITMLITGISAVCHSYLRYAPVLVLIIICVV